MSETTSRQDRAAAAPRHGEYKISGGKLVVVDLQVVDGCLRGVRLSGDFFLEPPEALDTINAALEGVSAASSAAQLAQAVMAALEPKVAMYGLSAEGIATVLQRALS
jgi:lipoate-protein ligase A